MSVDLLVVDDGSRDGTAHDRPRARRPRDRPRAPARPRRGAAHRARGRPRRGLRRGRLPRRRRRVRPGRLRDACSTRWRAGAPTTCTGSRFLGATRTGMTWHRTLANRATSALLGTLLHTVVTDGQTGYRAFSARALAAARIRHDYNYAQVLTLSLWGAGIDAGRGADLLPPPHERPLLRELPGVPGARGAGRLARVARLAHGEGRERRGRWRRPASTPSRRRAEEREDVLERAERRVRALGHERAARPAHVHVEPDGRRQRRAPTARCRPAARAAGPTRSAGPPAAATPAGAAAGTRSRTSSGRGRRRSAGPRARRRRGRRSPRSRARPAPRGRAGRAASATATRAPAKTSANTGAQRSRPYSRSMKSATRR